MIRGDVWRLRYGDVWVVDVIDEDGKWLAGTTFTTWEYAMQWANAEVENRRRVAAFRKFNDRMRDLAVTVRKLGLA